MVNQIISHLRRLYFCEIGFSTILSRLTALLNVNRVTDSTILLYLTALYKYVHWKPLIQSRLGRHYSREIGITINQFRKEDIMVAEKYKIPIVKSRRDKIMVERQNILSISPVGTILFLLIFSCINVFSQPKSSPPVSIGADGKLVYTYDELGNRMPDFSYCGYMAGEKPIPNVPAKVVVPVKEGDATFRIQAALDYAASLPADENGIRGAVLLEKGTYKVTGGLKMNASGVILRGSGMSENGTILLASGKDRHTLITVLGKNNKKLEQEIHITNDYIPVNSNTITVVLPNAFNVGDKVVVRRYTNQKWILTTGMNYFGGETDWWKWKPGERDLYWDRTIISIDKNILTLDVPITTALDTNYGGGSVTKYSWPGRIVQVGIENLCCRSTYNTNNPKDEDHCWMAITMENVSDAWIRQVVFEHFAGSAVALFESSKRVTVEDCKSLEPVSEIGGQRRYTFFTSGQQTLFQRCYAEYGYHDFAAGFCAAGPNAFVQCESFHPYSFSGGIDSWASGLLYDIVNIDGQALSFKNRGQDAHGAGWCAANSVFWQCTAARIDCYSPPTATNWACGCWSQYAGNGQWFESNSHINPRSLYYAQQGERVDNDMLEEAFLLPVEAETTSSPSIELAATLTAQSDQPAINLKEWIDQVAQRNPLPISTRGIKTIDQVGFTSPPAEEQKKDSIQIVNGWLVYKNRVLTGKRHNIQWWRGDPRPYEFHKKSPHITRFVPGRSGPGLTDDLCTVTEWMYEQNMVVLEHNYGLWYDRRRDDHVRVRRQDGEVWPPFYELPFARSGQGTAWDGLSKYDLFKYNYWYWNRLKDFADQAAQKGILLFHNNYFQHNILEAGAHWADFPWRTANNINSTGFPEPPPYAGDKRIFMDEQFYDITHPVRREIHRAYIRKCLENFSDISGVIQFISAEYTGPLHFVEFWLDVINEWQQETGKDATIALSVTKDVQDAILDDPARVQVVDLIDIRYWSYREDGTLYAQPGGIHLAPRQYARLVKPGKRSFEQVYKSVYEYRKKYPDKAIIYSEGRYDVYSWAVFMAGGSLACIPPINNPDFYKDASIMQPVNLKDNPSGKWALGNPESGYIIYSTTLDPVKLDLKYPGNGFKIFWINPKDGNIIKSNQNSDSKDAIEISTGQTLPVVIWITRM